MKAVLNLDPAPASLEALDGRIRSSRDVLGDADAGAADDAESREPHESFAHSPTKLPATAAPSATQASTRISPMATTRSSTGGSGLVSRASAGRSVAVV